MKKMLAIVTGFVFAFVLSACSHNLSVSGNCSDADQTSVGCQLENSQVQSIISATVESPDASGLCGMDLIWYYKNGVLCIIGTGQICYDKAPLIEKIRNKIVKIKIVFRNNGQFPDINSPGKDL